jgi:hypothetical protein
MRIGTEIIAFLELEMHLQLLEAKKISYSLAVMLEA